MSDTETDFTETETSDASAAAQTEAPAAVTEAEAPAAEAVASDPVRKPRNHPSMMIFHTLTPGEDGQIHNPRREGTFGWVAMQLAIDAGEEGLTYDKYVRGGGRPNDLAWDLAKGHVRVVDPTSDPVVQAQLKQEAEEKAAAKAAEKAARDQAKAEKAAAKAAEREEKRKTVEAQKAEAAAAKAAAKAEADAKKQAAAEEAEAKKQTASVANADKADANREAVEDGVGPIPTGDSPTSANKRARGGKKSSEENVATGIPV